MAEHYAPISAVLPLLLWRTPPGLELILLQEGVPFEVVSDEHRLAFRGGRFVLFDGRSTSRAALTKLLGPGHVALDIDELRRDEPLDPFAALIDNRSALAAWTIGRRELYERVARQPKAWIRRRLITGLREAVVAAGGIWARLASFPYPYRAAFSFRADLDEPVPEDYERFARARRPLDDCCTHFVSTHAYSKCPSVMEDLRDRDTQSHGHFHHVYRVPDANQANLDRAHRILRGFDIEPLGFAAPHGRWNAGLDDAIEDLGYLYSSDFQLGYDDLPFFPWRGDRFSRALQLPVHPLCEGLFLEAGITNPHVIGEHLAAVVAARLDAGELAIAYGHPERRLGRMPAVLEALAREVGARPLVWRTTFTGLARWWRWRAERRWMLIPGEDNRLEVHFDDWDDRYALAVEIHRGGFYCSLPLSSPRTTINHGGLVFQRGPGPSAVPGPPRMVSERISLKQVVRTAIDWEMATPLAEIPRSSLANRMKRGLRWWKHEAVEAIS